MAWREGFLSVRKIDEAPQSIDDLWLDLGYLVRQRPIRRLAGPGKKNPGIHSIEVTFERTGKFVRLKPSNHAYEKLARQAARSNRMNGLAFANCSAHSASITQARTISR